MKLEVGKKYRTRDGLEVFGPIKIAIDTTKDFPYEGRQAGYCSISYFGPNGEFWGDGGEEYGWDLVEEVTDDRADNPSPAVVPGHNPEAGHSYHDGTGSECLEVPPLELRAEKLRSWLVSGLAAVSRVVRRLCGKSVVRDGDYYDLSSR